MTAVSKEYCNYGAHVGESLAVMTRKLPSASTISILSSLEISDSGRRMSRRMMTINMGRVATQTPPPDLFGSCTPFRTLHITDQDVSQPESESVGKALKPIFMIGSFLALPNYNERFHWRNWKTVSCLFFMSWGLFLTLMTILKVSNESFSYSSLGELSFYSLATVYIVLFFKLSREWPSLMEEWLRIEDGMQGLPTVRAFGKVLCVTVFLLSLAAWEHLLNEIKEMLRASLCIDHKFSESYYVVHFAQVFRLISFSIGFGLVLSTINFILTMIWNFADIFIICVSLALSARFEQLHISLKQVIGQDMTIEFWRESRERYVRLYLLTKNLDENLSFLMLFSFANNLYGMCCILYNALNIKDVPTLQVVYYCTSFGLVLLRLFGICLSAGKIHETSKAILPILFSVPSKTYNIEVHRLFMQIWQDPLSLTGSRFFSVTRSLVLKIAGTIVTYEIVLIQFNTSNTNEDAANTKVKCTID